MTAKNPTIYDRLKAGDQITLDEVPGVRAGWLLGWSAPGIPKIYRQQMIQHWPRMAWQDFGHLAGQADQPLPKKALLLVDEGQPLAMWMPGATAPRWARLGFWLAERTHATALGRPIASAIRWSGIGWRLMALRYGKEVLDAMPHWRQNDSKHSAKTGAWPSQDSDQNRAPRP